jgi:hypothetical protein
MKNRRTYFRLFKYFYAWIMPVVTIISLIVVSQFIRRPLLFGSAIADFLGRLWISLCYCANYVILADPERYRTWIYGRRIEQRKDQEDLATILGNIGMGVMLGFFVFMITRWVMQVFLLIPKDINWILSILNGLICAIPLIARRKQMLI